jgi:hypothetical protein
MSLIQEESITKKCVHHVAEYKSHDSRTMMTGFKVGGGGGGPQISIGGAGVKFTTGLTQVFF